MEKENADAANDDRGQHHLEQGVVAQPQLRDDDVGVRNPRALQQPAEGKAEDDAERQQRRSGDRQRHRRAPALPKRSEPTRMAVPNIRIVNAQLDSANCRVPLMP